MQKIILLSLFILTCSKLNAIEFDKEIPFDRNNNVFEFTTKGDGALFLSITFPVSNLLRANFTGCGFSSDYSINKPGQGNIFSFESGKTCKLELIYKDQTSNVKGTIWMHPSTDEIKVDLNETYEWKYDVTELVFQNYQIIYSIDNAERDVTFIFNFKDTIPGKTVKNPFKVCHGEECQEDITTYDFKKGESYKIYATVYNSILPAFSFHDIDKKDDDESDSTDQTDSDSTDQTDSDSTDQTDSDSTDHTDSDTTDGKNYSYYLSLNLLAISILLLSL